MKFLKNLKTGWVLTAALVALLLAFLLGGNAANSFSVGINNSETVMNALATEYRLGHLDFKPNSADDVRFLPESASKTKLQKLSKEGDEAFLVGVTSVIGAFGLGSIAGVLLVLIVIRNLFRRNSGLIPRH